LATKVSIKRRQLLDVAAVDAHVDVHDRAAVGERVLEAGDLLRERAGDADQRVVDLGVGAVDRERDLGEAGVERLGQEVPVGEQPAVGDGLDARVAGQPAQAHEVDEARVDRRLAARQDQAGGAGLAPVEDLPLDLLGVAQLAVVGARVEAEDAAVVAVVGEAHPVARSWAAASRASIASRRTSSAARRAIHAATVAWSVTAGWRDGGRARTVVVDARRDRARPAPARRTARPAGRPSAAPPRRPRSTRHVEALPPGRAAGGARDPHVGSAGAVAAVGRVTVPSTTTSADEPGDRAGIGGGAGRRAQGRGIGAMSAPADPRGRSPAHCCTARPAGA
jgi:hypothetical protein